MKRKSPSEDRLIQELKSQNFSTKPFKHAIARDPKKLLEELTTNKNPKDLYLTQDQAIKALLECGLSLLVVLEPFELLGPIHDRLPDCAVRDAVGQLHFGENISPETQGALRFEGVNSNTIFLLNRGKKS